MGLYGSGGHTTILMGVYRLTRHCADREDKGVVLKKAHDTVHCCFFVLEISIQCVNCAWCTIVNVLIAFGDGSEPNGPEAVVFESKDYSVDLKLIFSG